MFSPKTEFDNLKERVSKLEEDAKETAQQLSNHEANINSTRDIADQNKIDIEELKNMLKNLMAVESKPSAQGDGVNLDDLKDILNKLKELEEKLDGKVDLNDFKNEIASLRSMIGELDAEDKKNSMKTQMPSGGGQGADKFSADEMKKLRDMMGKFPSIEEML